MRLMENQQILEIMKKYINRIYSLRKKELQLKKNNF